MNFGTLHLPTGRPAAELTAAWGDQPVFCWLLIGAGLIILFLLPELYKLFPSVTGCFIRSRGNIEVEHSISTARSRNLCARALVIPFLLASSRYGLFTPEFLAGWDRPWLNLAELTGIAAAFLAVRRIIHAMLLSIGKLRFGHDELYAVTRGILNFFILFMLLALPSICLLRAFSASDIAVRMLLWTEMALFWGVSTVREGQILSSGCSGLATFLYLCGLEFIPAAGLIIAGICL